MDGFFTESDLTQKNRVTQTFPMCGTCKLYKKCLSPKMQPTGKGKKKILIIEESPGELEDKRGKHFVGETGRFLKYHMAEKKVDLYRDCWTTTAIICKPVKKIPTEKQVQACTPNLIKTIKNLNPEIIIPMGGISMQAFLLAAEGHGTDKRQAYAGEIIPYQGYNAWVCPTYHTEFLLQQGDSISTTLINRHLSKAFAKIGTRPYHKVPNYGDYVQRILDENQVCDMISDIIKSAAPASFDYETNCLKPEYSGAAIYSCAISTGLDNTFAFPWTKRIAKVMREFLRCRCPKIAANLKFEDRWSRQILKTPVKHWVWDTMVSAHVLNNAKGITDLTHQVFVNFGQSCYDKHIKPYLKSTKGEFINRIHLINTMSLLLYNGYDSLFEYMLAFKQMKKARFKI